MLIDVRTLYAQDRRRRLFALMDQHTAEDPATGTYLQKARSLWHIWLRDGAGQYHPVIHFRAPSRAEAIRIGNERLAAYLERQQNAA